MTFIQNHLNHYTVSQLCSALKFPRSTYYKALVRVPSNRQEEYEEFGRKVKQAYDESRQRYGAVKICRTLNNNGTLCSVKRVQRHMEQQGLRSVVVKKYNHHANHGASRMIKQISWNVISRQEPSIRNGVLILPTFMCWKRGGLIWPPWWICAAARLSDMPMAHPWQQNWQ